MVAAHPHIDPTGPAWADPVYDAAGNMTTAPWPSSLTTGLSCKYDAWNRLVEVKNGETVYAAHEYDGLNRRTIEIPGLGSTYYMHKYWNSSWQMLEQRQNTNDAAPESSGVARQCIWSPRYIDALVLENLWGTRRYFLGDANFNVTSVINTSGDAYEHYQYDPYGKVTILNGGSPDSDGDEWTADPNNSTDISNHYLYTGRWQDFKTLFYYNRNRYYHAELGRFISRDPIGYEAGDVNLYRYVGNQPPTAVDPMGEGVRLPPPPPGGWKLATITACYLGCKGLNRKRFDCDDCCEQCGRLHGNICLKMTSLTKRALCTIAARNSSELCRNGVCCSKPVVLPPPGGGCEHWVGVVAMLVVLLTYLGLTRRKHDCRSWE